MVICFAILHSSGNRKTAISTQNQCFHIPHGLGIALSYKYEHEIKASQSEDSMSLVTVTGLRMDTWPKEV